MSPLRECEEAILQRWAAQWVVAPGGDPLTPFFLQDETAQLPPDHDGPWVRLLVQSRPGGPGTLGSPGNRKMDRAGVVFALLRQPPNRASGALSDLAEKARDIYENCRFGPHDMRFGAVQIGAQDAVEQGRWTGVTVEARFDYEQLK